MDAPERLSVPTCVGCGAMGKLGTCETGCIERKLELVRAASHDWITDVGSRARADLETFGPVIDELATHQPGEGEWEAAYRSLREKARAALLQQPGAGWDEAELEQAAEAATTWWRPECGGIDAPQPCLGICVWRPIEWVRQSVYEREREHSLRDYRAALRMRVLLRQITPVMPRAGHWERTWHVLAADARQTLLLPAR